MICFEQVSVSYDGGKSFAVRQVSLQVRSGELLVLLGESGCGKTTTLKLVNRLVEPSSGRVLLGGRAVAELDPATLRRGIGYAFQGVGLFPHLSVGENVGVVPRLLGWPGEKIRRRADELLELIGLAPASFRDRFPRSLSGGQQQRVGLARALAAQPSVMLMDEPFGAVDPLIRSSLRSEYRRLHAQLGLTTMLVTHDMTEALLLADRIAVIHQGELAGVGTPRELLEGSAHPHVRRLLETPLRQSEEVARRFGGAPSS